MRLLLKLALFLCSFALLCAAGAGCDPQKDYSLGTGAEEDEGDDGDGPTPENDDDADGLSNTIEDRFEIETTIADSDHDGFSDGLEFVGGSGDPLDGSISPNPFSRARILQDEDVVRNDPDGDQDGLGDTFERAKSLDENDADTDDDGYSDGLELVANSDPFVASDVPERDAPPAWDGVERNGSGPSDRDDDGLSDEVEALNGTRPSDRDTDGDGFSDGLEYLMGSDATDVKSVPNFNVPLPPADFGGGDSEDDGSIDTDQDGDVDFEDL